MERYKMLTLQKLAFEITSKQCSVDNFTYAHNTLTAPRKPPPSVPIR
jgi:hypothetical protein